VALKEAGNYVISINGARSKDLVILEKEMKAVSDESYITTDDGSYGDKGFVTQKLQALIDGGKKIDFVLAIGPIPMMRAVAEVTRPHGIKTVVSLNPIMVDGTGMCGGCRVIVGGKSEFACVDGPEFDAHDVDFDNLMMRNAHTPILKRSRLISMNMNASSAGLKPPLSEDKMRNLTAKERMAIERHHMPEQAANKRNKNFEEVNLGYTAEMAIAEAERCIQCKKPLCVGGCPVNIDIPGFINEIAAGNFQAAADVFKN